MVREQRTKADWAWCIKELVDVHYPEAPDVSGTGGLPTCKPLVWR